jgi:hypothetical protein
MFFDSASVTIVIPTAAYPDSGHAALDVKKTQISCALQRPLFSPIYLPL